MQIHRTLPTMLRAVEVVDGSEGEIWMGRRTLVVLTLRKSITIIHNITVLIFSTLIEDKCKWDTYSG